MEDIFDNLYTMPVTTTKEAEAFIVRLVNENKDYHLDDDPEEMITFSTGKLLFTEAEAKSIRLRVSASFDHLADPFQTMLDALAIREAKDPS